MKHVPKLMDGAAAGRYSDVFWGCPVPLASGICGEFAWGQGGSLCDSSMDVSLKSPRFWFLHASMFFFVVVVARTLLWAIFQACGKSSTCKGTSHM